MKNSSPSGRLPLLSKFAYGMGDVGCNFSWMFVGNFLMIFYTDAFGISMGAVSVLMLISRFWDAINDPVIGELSDRTHTRWGRFRPWLLIASPLTALVLVLTFWAHPEWSNTAKIIYMSVTYCVLVLGYTCVNNIITIPLIHFFGGDDIKTGFLLVAILYGCIFAACHIFCFANTKEVVAIPKKQKIPVRQLSAARQNTPYLLALAGQLLFGIINYGRNADLVYYFKYVEGDSNLFSTYSLAIIIPSIIGAASFVWVFEKLNNKGWAAAFFSFCTGIAFNTAIYAIIPDCVEYGEWKTGIRNDGFQYAFVSLGNKIGMAIGTALLAWAIADAGYVANTVQNQEVLNIIHHCFSTIPGVLWVLTGFVLLFYKLNRKTYDKIFSELQQRKNHE